MNPVLSRFVGKVKNLSDAQGEYIIRLYLESVLEELESIGRARLSAGGVDICLLRSSYLPRHKTKLVDRQEQIKLLVETSDQAIETLTKKTNPSTVVRLKRKYYGRSAKSQGNR